MSDTFTGIMCFAPYLSAEQRCDRAKWLSKACERVPEARPAAIALGSLYDPAKRDEALRVLNSMPSLPRRHVLATYQKLSRGRG